MSQTVPEYSDCPWPVDPACLGTDWTDLDPALQDRAVALASSTLRRLTGYRVGGCPLTVRPCRRSCTDVTVMPGYFSVLGSYTPHLSVAGVWVNSCGCNYDCSCDDLCQVVLPGPVGGITSVKVDGSVIDPADYRVYGTRVLWTGPGDCPWSTCQDLTLDDDQPGTFSITYLNSYAVDGLGAYAAGTLAYEYAQACTGGKCRLPSNVTLITRQGVSYEIASGSFPDGYTGIREVDAYIAMWRPPDSPSRPPTVWSPSLRTPPVVR